jgi:hypothetical protein
VTPVRKKEIRVADSKVPDFSNEAIVTSVGVTIVQALDFLANELKMSEEETKQLWSPFLAATARMIKPADDMAAVFQNAAKTEKVKNAISAEINRPNIDFYDPFSDSLRQVLKMITESVGECSYLAAVENQGSFSKQEMAAELLEMMNFYIEDQNSKGRKIQPTDDAFKTIFCTALPQHVEDVMQGNSFNGIKNTGQMVQLGQVAFSTALLLQIVSGMLG